MQPIAIAYTWYVFGGKGGEDVSTVELDFLKSKMADLQLKGLGGGMGSVICLYAKMLMTLHPTSRCTQIQCLFKNKKWETGGKIFAHIFSISWRKCFPFSQGNRYG